MYTTYLGRLPHFPPQFGTGLAWYEACGVIIALILCMLLRCGLCVQLFRPRHGVCDAKEPSSLFSACRSGGADVRCTVKPDAAVLLLISALSGMTCDLSYFFLSFPPSLMNLKHFSFQVITACAIGHFCRYVNQFLRRSFCSKNVCIIVGSRRKRARDYLNVLCS